MRYILAHDLGTSRHKAVLTTLRGEMVACVAQPLVTTSPQPGWAEQCAHMWWSAVTQSTRTLLRDTGIAGASVRALSFTGQTQAALPVDAAGAPLCDALIWLDARAKPQSLAVLRGWPKFAGYGLWRLLRWLRRTNGGPTLCGRDFVAKVLWLREERPDVWRHVHRVLDAKDYLLWRCTGQFVTSHDCGHLTWLMDVHRCAWSRELLRMAGIDAGVLPRLMPSLASAGPLVPDAARALGLPVHTPVIVGATDVASLAVGSGALGEGEACVGLGTSAWVSAHTRRHCVSVTTYTASITSALPNRPLVVAHQEMGGGCIPWFLRMVRALCAGEDVATADYTWLQQAVSQTAPGADGLLFTPWLAGEYAPLQDSNARGSFFGLGLQHRPAHLGRAVMEGVAYNLRWALQSVQALTGIASPHLRMAGGGAQSDAWCQILADVCQRPVMRPDKPAFTTAMGAARLAGLHLGAFADVHALHQQPPASATFLPNRALADLYDAGFTTYRRYYKRTRSLSRASFSPTPE